MEVQKSTVIPNEESAPPAFMEKFDMKVPDKVNKSAQQKKAVSVESYRPVVAVLMVLVLVLILAVVILCIAFSVEIASSKSEIESGREQGLMNSQTQQQLASNSSLELEMLSQKLLQDISAINSKMQELNSSLEMQLQDIISTMNSRTQELNSSLEILSKEQLQDRQEISATIDGRTIDSKDYVHGIGNRRRFAHVQYERTLSSRLSGS